MPFAGWVGRRPPGPPRSPSRTGLHLGGFAVVDVPDDDTARYWAGRLAVALDWPQEVHRFPGRLQGS